MIIENRIEHEGLDLTEDFIRRMRNWARAGAGCGPGEVRAMDCGAVMGGSGYRESDMPCLSGEALDTDEALRTLPLRYRQAVQDYWRYEGRSWVWYGRRRSVCDKTAKSWVIKGHDLLRPELARRTEAHRARALNNVIALKQCGLITP